MLHMARYSFFEEGGFNERNDGKLKKYGFSGKIYKSSSVNVACHSCLFLW